MVKREIGLNVSRRAPLPISARHRLRRVVARRNEAVVRYRKLVKFGEKSDVRERFFAEEIARLDAEIAGLRAKPELPNERERAAEAGPAAEHWIPAMGCDG